MGIKNLNKLLSDEAPECMRMSPLKSLSGRKIALDASMAIYQFLIAVRQGGPDAVHQQLTNEKGETTSHIQGMFNRTVKFLTEGIKPAYVFDGKPPQLKSGELLKRREKRQKAEADLKAAKESGDADEQNKQEKRLVRAGQKENEDCKKVRRERWLPNARLPANAFTKTPPSSSASWAALSSPRPARPRLSAPSSARRAGETVGVPKEDPTTLLPLSSFPS